MTEPEPRTRTPRLNPYLITIDIPDGGPAVVLVEANSITEARAWFMEHMLTIDRADHRSMHFHGAAGTPLFNAYEPLGQQAVEQESPSDSWLMPLPMPMPPECDAEDGATSEPSIDP
jgi:hypothetical protein